MLEKCCLMAENGKMWRWEGEGGKKGIRPSGEEHRALDGSMMILIYAIHFTGDDGIIKADRGEICRRFDVQNL